MYLLKRSVKRKFNKLKENAVDFWYKYVLRKEKPSKYIDSKEYVALIKEEVYKVWPKKELVALLASYGTSFGDVKLPEDLTKEQLCELYMMHQEMYKRYIKATEMIIDKIRNLELDCEVVYQNKYIKKKETSRQALMIDELIEYLEKLKLESFETEISEETKETLTVAGVERRLNEMQFYMELVAIYFPSVVSQADLKKALNKMDQLLANPPSRK